MFRLKINHASEDAFNFWIHPRGSETILKWLKLFFQIFHDYKKALPIIFFLLNFSVFSALPVQWQTILIHKSVPDCFLSIVNVKEASLLFTHT